MRDRPSANHDRALFWMLLCFGSLWGAGEALVGGLLHLVLPPTYAGRVMLLFAGGLCTIAVRATGRSWAPLALASVAAPLKLCSAAIYGMPVAVPMVMTPFFSILSQGAAFALIARWLLARSALTPARFALFGSLAGGLQTLLFMILAVAASRWLYPPPSVIESLGMAYPAWTLSPAGWLGLLGSLGPMAVLFGGVAALVAGLVPLGGVRRWRPLYLGAGTMLCLVLSLLSYWLV
ncbi:MAG: hypothetical protein KAY32_14625 [Candidatus Eisenbacteria sp.]|nr:hypothetical protein [Candidatus Eisenbacteria bacterium]